jgi:conjugal transfer/entry exclusion protein
VISLQNNTNTNMTTKTASECSTNSLSVSPQGDHWQAIKVNPQPTLEEIIAKVCRQLEAIETQIETINNQLKNI